MAYFHIVAGSYDHWLLGFECQEVFGADEHGEPTTEMNTLFAYAPHEGCIKCLATNGALLASGSTDEIVKLYDMARLSEVGELTQHSGAVRALQFHGKRNMISGGEDGKMCIWRSTGGWDCVELKGHPKGGITGLSIHPSGKLALSVGPDCTLRLWDLVRGRCAHKMKLSVAADEVQWSPTGTRYATLSMSRMEVRDTETSEVLQSIAKEGETFLCMAWVSDNLIATGGEGKDICVWNISSGEMDMDITGHTNRIRGLATVPRSLHPSLAGAPTPLPLLVSASSDGTVRVWRLDQGNGVCVAANDTGARLTCVCAGSRPAHYRHAEVMVVEEEEEPEKKKKKKRRKGEEEMEEEEKKKKRKKKKE